MKSIQELKEGDYIAFWWPYGINGKEIIVDSITSIDNGRALVHFLYGYKSEAEFVPLDDIIAIGNTNGSGKIKGWGGSFDIIKPLTP